MQIRTFHYIAFSYIFVDFWWNFDFVGWEKTDRQKNIGGSKAPRKDFERINDLIFSATWDKC